MVSYICTTLSACWAVTKYTDIERMVHLRYLQAFHHICFSFLLGGRWKTLNDKLCPGFCCEYGRKKQKKSPLYRLVQNRKHRSDPNDNTLSLSTIKWNKSESRKKGDLCEAFQKRFSFSSRRLAFETWEKGFSHASIMFRILGRKHSHVTLKINQ